MPRAYTFEAVAERLATEPKPFRLVASRLLWKSGLCRAFTIARPGYRLRFYPSAYSSLLWLYPDGSLEDERVLRAILRPGDTAVDVGANIGTLALCASACVGESGQVTALEAHPRTFGFLAGNLSLNHARNVKALNLAVGDSEGEIRLTDGPLDDQNAATRRDGVAVSMRPLDSLIPRGSIRLLKIDVEGFELPVLRGAAQLLKRTEFAYLECWDRLVERYGFKLCEVIESLEDAGLQPYRFATRKRLIRVRGDEALPICENILAVRDPRLAGEQTGFEFEEQHVSTHAACAQPQLA